MKNLAGLKTKNNYYKNYNFSTYKSREQRQNDLADDLNEIIEELLKHKDLESKTNTEENVVDVSLNYSQFKEIQCEGSGKQCGQEQCCDKVEDEIGKQSVEDCDKECDEDCLEFKVREESLKSDLLSFAFNGLILDNECEIVGKSQEKLSDEAVERLAFLLNRAKFAKLSEEDAQFLLSDFTFDICDYIGIKLPTVECKGCENEGEIEAEAGADFNLSFIKQKAKVIKERCSRSELKEFALEVTEPLYGESGYENVLFLTHFRKEFFNNINAILGVKKNALQKFLQQEYVMTVRHECQHLYQYAKIRDYFNGKNVETKFKVMAITEVMRGAILDYMDESYVCGFEYEPASYHCNSLEIDARHSEFTFLKSLIEDDRVSEHNKKALKTHMLYLLNDFLIQSQHYKNINGFAKLRITSLKFEFEKTFGHLPLARFLISELNSINLDAYISEIENYEKMYKKEYIKLIKERKASKDKAEKQKNINKIDKLNAIYEF